MYRNYYSHVSIVTRAKNESFSRGFTARAGGLRAPKRSEVFPSAARETTRRVSMVL